MFTRVLPHFGADYSFKMESYLSYVKRRVDSGELEFKHPLNMRVTVQESCYGKQFGPEYMNIPRELLSKAGAEVVEMENSRECMLCCGIGAGFSPYSAYNPLKLTASTIKVMRSAKRSGAEAVATYCSGCMQMFSTGLVVYRTALPVYHILELLGMAMGETSEPFKGRLARNMLAGVVRHQGPVLLSRKRFKAPDIDTGIEQK
jgi:Fe-S oxidoreductase